MSYEEEDTCTPLGALSHVTWGGGYMSYEEEDTCTPLGALSHDVKFKQDKFYEVFTRRGKMKGKLGRNTYV